MKHDDDRNEKNLTRRDFHRLGGAFVLAAAVPAAVARTAFAAHHEKGEEKTAAAGGGLVTDFKENEQVISAVQFVAESAKEGQNCSGCILYTAGEGGRGKCTLFSKGEVPENGWCLSWAAKPA